jgi:aminopeptidase
MTGVSGTRLDDRLAALAEVCVTVGVNVQPGQALVVTAPVEAAPLVRHVGRIAYQRGAALVTCLYDDPALIRDRLLHAGDADLDRAPAWLHDGLAAALRAGAARLTVAGPYPDLLAGIPVDRIARAHRALARASEAEAEIVSASRVNHSTVPYATGSWARRVFPDLPADEAVRALWGAILDATRVSDADPRGAWAAHTRALRARRDRLQERGYAALHVVDGRTDVMIGLAGGHRWLGGAVVAGNGVEATPTIPTEEVFTCPHRERTEGRIVFSRPLALGGTRVEHLAVELRDGAITSARAASGLEIFERLIASDDGARRLGKIALVPASSRIAATGILFHNPLLDQNAASHVTFGHSSAACPQSSGAPPRAPEDSGANVSAIHIDAMFGTPSTNVDGVLRDGTTEPLMRDGEFLPVT